MAQIKSLKNQQNYINRRSKVIKTKTLYISNLNNTNFFYKSQHFIEGYII